MRDPRLNKLADILVHHCTRVKPGDLVTIVGEHGAMAAVEAIFESVLKAGGNPSFHARSDRLFEILLRHGSGEQLRHVCPVEEFRLSHCDVLIVLRHQQNTKFLGKLDGKRAAMSQAARRPLIAMSMKRAADQHMRYSLTEIPSHAAAQDAEMSLEQYTDRLFDAGFIRSGETAPAPIPMLRPGSFATHHDALHAWSQLREQQGELCRYLSGKKLLRFRAPAARGNAASDSLEGTDVVVDVEGRTWVNCAGGENFPDGEVFSGPRSVEGVVNFTFPAIYRGKEVEGVRLEFRAGRVVDASAAKNAAYLLEMLSLDEGASIVGEIGIGTNYALTEYWKNAFFDEKIGGTFHLALGAGYPETGNTNQSGLHWDMVSDLRWGGTIEADGEVIQRDGKFLLFA